MKESPLGTEYHHTARDAGLVAARGAERVAARRAERVAERVRM